MPRHPPTRAPRTDARDAADVIVIGAGPAGAWAAFRLARAGARVALVDASHPREKPCGGGVTGRALELVADAVPVADLPSRRIRSARFVDATSRRSVAVPLARDALVVASRTEFDGMLLAAACRAGAQLVRARALDVARASGRFIVETSAGLLTAPQIIGADGANSLVRRRLACPFARSELSIATGYFAHGAEHDDVIIELAGSPPGYLWSFPRPSHLAVGICAQADEKVTAGELRGRTRDWMDRMALCGPARLVAYSWPIPSLPAAALRSPTVSGPGWYLAGDAAGLVDPITREGIYFALRSGELAADAAASGAHAAYGDRVHDEITADLAVAAGFKAGFFKPRFTRLLLDALAESDRIRAIMAELVAGRRAYSTLRRSLAGTLEFGIAWRVLTAS